MISFGKNDTCAGVQAHIFLHFIARNLDLDRNLHNISAWGVSVKIIIKPFHHSVEQHCI